ncbi:hypothetical protein GCM10010492_50870 [Saccharothrix mutabilis subsp. mutabilis]|uniref:Metallo-beta-lactamase domain-containing protein n=1 Tax=Saccharothrix mutabilis subsp. mutabilis TaxID=66855 RepID=A0ABN0UBR1_9PSEU
MTDLREVAPGVRAWVQADGTWHAGGEVVLIDTCATRRRTQAFLDAVSAASGGAPIKAALNTHLHGDHVYGTRWSSCPATGR